LKFEYLREFEPEFENVLGYELGDHMGSFHEKNQGPKISCYCTFETVGQPLGNDKKVWESHWKNAKRLLDSVWAILELYWKATGKCPNKTYTY
jgi:hypothetical protein